MAKLFTICEDDKFKGRSSRYRYYSMYVLKDVDKTGNLNDSSIEIEKLDYKMKMVKYDYESPEYCAVVVGYHDDNIYIIGGADSERKPKRDVLVLPLNSGLKSKSIKGPSLISGKFNPIAVSTKNHLYVFSRILHEIGFKPEFSSLEELPRCEVLSWDSGSVWSALPIPSITSLPPLPDMDSQYQHQYQIDAYVSGSLQCFDGVFISIKNLCSYFVSVDHGWTFSPKELPFKYEAKLIYSDVYAGASRKSLYSGFIVLYRFMPDEGNFHFDQLSIFPLFSNSIVGQSFPDHCFDNWMFQPLSPNKLCLIHSCVPPETWFDSSSPTTTKAPFLLVRVVKLNWEGETGDGGAAATTSSKKRKRKTSPHFELLGLTKCPHMPSPQNWCFLPN